MSCNDEYRVLEYRVRVGGMFPECASLGTLRVLGTRYILSYR